MAEQAGQEVVQSQAEVQDQLPSIEELLKTNQRLLEESKKYKEKAKSFESLVQKIEQEKLEKSSNEAEKIEILQKKLQETEEKSKQLAKKTIREAINNRLLKYAPDAYNHSDLMNQSEFADILREGIDEESMTVSDEAVKAFVAKIQEVKPYMFKPKNDVGTFNKKPPVDAPKSKPVESMSLDEAYQVLKQNYGGDKSLF